MTDAISRARASGDYPDLRLFIDGCWIDGERRELRAVVDPTTLTELGRLPCASDADLTRAIGAAERAFATWGRSTAIERSRMLRAAADWLRTRRRQWAGRIALELGKPLVQADAEVETACEMFEWAAEEARRLYGRLIPGRTRDMRLMTIVEPVGPVGAVSGWNAPAVTPSRKIAGALAAGCTIIIKPSEATPASALMIAEAFEAAGLPAGVLNVLFGDPPVIGHRFATDPAIRLLTFTGGTAVGKNLAALCAGTLKRTILELGGHAPALVCDDVDVEAVAAAAVTAKYRNGGQICTSPTRFFVEAGIYPRFVEAFTNAAAKLVVGDPFDAATQMGPLQNAARVQSIHALIGDAVSLGGTLMTGTAPEGPGSWCPPSVISDIPANARALHEEPFGPLALIGSIQTIDEGIALANRLPLGLAAYAFTHDLRTAERLTRDIQAGTLAINHWAASYAETPFGGVKESGLAHEGGSEGLAAFTQLRFASILA